MQDRRRQFDEIFLQRTAGPYIRVKNGPDALEMGCRFYPRKQTPVSCAADCDVIVCYGGAKLTDKHLASKIQCVDDEIFEWLERREQRRDRLACSWQSAYKYLP
jgi:hypothetical protein